ncbi:MAG: dimethyl sulfoxide reductase anchor subunit [Rhizobiaceae bacterium]|nr:dimethyl sulfoxide reductase anchor subunit [Rhizobiaceae bacterium]
MHPAPSIIIFTTLSGLGYGLAAVLGLGLLDPAAFATGIAWLAALAMIGGGLLSSTLHLGNPQRAWRALSQWRSSWLSREGVMAVLTFVPLLWSAVAAAWFGRWSPLAGLAGSAMCLVTVFCTGMIYASLRAIDAWHTRLTPVCYVLFAVAGGLTLATSFAAISGAPLSFLALASILAQAAAWWAKHLWWNRLDAQSARSSPETATGLGALGRVKLFERPHFNDNYLTREMGFGVARKHAAKLRRIALISGAAAPAAFLVIAAASDGFTWLAVPAALAAAMLHAAGILVERWLFFAEARHSVMNYY